MQPGNHLKFSVGGKELPLISFDFSQSLDSPCAQFRAVVAPELVGQVLPLVGKEALISKDNWSRYCIVDALAFDAPKRLEIVGRDEISLLVDNSAEVFEFKGKQSLAAVAKKLFTHSGLVVDNTVASGYVEEWSINPGETIYEALERAASPQNIFLVSHTGRDLAFLSPGRESVQYDESKKIQSFTYTKDLSERFGRYIGKADDDGASFWSGGGAIRAEKIDKEANQKKVKIITLSPASQKQLEKKLEAESKTRAERSSSMSIILPGYCPVSLGSAAKINLFGIEDRGMIKSFSYSISCEGDTEESSTICIGGLVG